MLCKTNAGGGGGVATAWAYIGVTYPEGSTCTASNGLYTLSAPDTSGLYVFGVPEPLSTPETWTVTSTNGVKTKSAEVEISDHYQNTVVVLRYSRLPEGYQEVEYLESSGTQHIDLGYTTELPSLEHDLTFENLSNGSVVFGNSNTSATTTHIGRTTSNSPWRISYYYMGTLVEGNHYKGDKISAVVNNANGEIVEDGITLATITGSSGSARLIMFGAFSNGGNIDHANARIYSYKQTNLSTDTIVYNLVPCYRTTDDVAGFYDLANNAFLTNDGTGSFIVGADV